MTVPFAALSDQIAALAATAAPSLVTLWPGTRAQRTGFAWQPGVIVTSEQNLPADRDIPVTMPRDVSGSGPGGIPGGVRGTATVAGRDTGTNVAVLRLEIDAAAPTEAPARVGAMALALGAQDGSATASLGVVHQVGPAWDSMAGGTIDQLIRLDIRLTVSAEGGPVLDAAGNLLGMSTFGPRRRVLVIPAATIRRVVPALLESGTARGWLGVGLQPVGLPTSMQAAAGREAGLMVISLAPRGPAEEAGLLPGDILLDVDGAPAPHPRVVARVLSGGRVGQVVPLRLLRGGAPIDLPATIGERPAA